VSSARASIVAWVLDSSVFIHFCYIERFRLLIRCRAPLHITTYVYQVELTGPKSHDATRVQALAAVAAGHVDVRSLTLAELARIAELGPRRKAGLGELTCAVIAQRSGAGVLIDDRKARRFLEPHFDVGAWESTEDVLIEAAHRCEVTEFELVEIQACLSTHKYECRCDLRNEYLMQRLNR